MGGHGHEHGHHHEPYVVPKPEVYNRVNTDSIKELRELKTELAKRGLKDPWIRNEVWRYDKRMWAQPKFRLARLMLRGLPLGLACAVATIAYEIKFEVYKDHHHDDHHGGHH